MRLHFRVEKKFGCKSPITPIELFNIFKGVTQYMDLMLGTKKKWYEQGYSRKQALEHQIFDNGNISSGTLSRWEKEYKKDYPNWSAGIWDGGSDEDSAGIDCYSSYSSTGRRLNPLSLVITFPLNLANTPFNLERMLGFIHYLTMNDDLCTYLSVESGDYGGLEVVSEGDNYLNVYKKVFPDRISVGWIVYIPAIILPELIPEAARVVPVMNGDKQKGTLIISTEEVFDGNKKEHIEKSNDIEIKLLDLGCLPLMTEL